MTLARDCLGDASTQATVDHSPTDHILEFAYCETELAYSAILGGPARVQVSAPAGASKETSLWSHSVSFRHPNTPPKAVADAYVTLYVEGKPHGVVTSAEKSEVASRLIRDLRLFKDVFIDK